MGARAGRTTESFWFKDKDGLDTVDGKIGNEGMLISGADFEAKSCLKVVK